MAVCRCVKDLNQDLAGLGSRSLTCRQSGLLQR